MSDSDILLKLRRARTHIDEFRAKAVAIRNGYCSMQPEEDPNLRMTVMRISIVPKAPDQSINLKSRNNACLLSICFRDLRI
jgi:hypothetical protein